MTSVSSLLIFSDKELRSLGLVWAAHALRPGIGKVGNNLINRGCIVSFGQFKSYLSQHQDTNQQAVPHSTQAEGKNNAAPRLPHLHILVVSNTFLFPMGWHEQSECQPALPKPGNSLGGSLWECFVSSNTKKCESWHMHVHADSAKPSHHQLPNIRHSLPQLLRASAQQPRALSTLRPSSSSALPSHSPATGLQTLGSTYGNISTTHLQTKRDTGSIKKNMHNSGSFRSCSSRKIYKYRLLIRGLRNKKCPNWTHSFCLNTLFLHCLWLTETKHVSICVLHDRLTISVQKTLQSQQQLPRPTVRL